ncbi:MAG: type VI secretion system protein TssA [Bryobacterales bacterium]|nr:type VI secretion system protein TssA [Bryobacterales bacterium]
MASAPVIDIEQLLAPLDSPTPAGKDISNTTILTELREMRKSDEGENLGDWALKEANVPSWPKITKIASNSLTNDSKDLRVAGYLTEALIKQYGMPGLRDGLRLMREMQERFWDYFYPSIQPPEPDEDGFVDEEESGIEMRAAALGQIDRLLPLAIRGIRATKPQMSTTFYSHLDWDQANYVDNLKVKETKAYEEAIAEGKPTGELFRKAVSTTPRTFYETWIADLTEAAEELRLLNALIEERYTEAEEMPTLSQVSRTIESLDQMIGDIEKIVGKLRESNDNEDTGGGGGGDTGEDGGGGGGGGGGSRRKEWVGDGVPLDPQDRNDAIKRLQAVAMFFKTNEPHSPVGYLVERAIYWASLPFEKWLEEVVKDAGVLDSVKETLGIKPPPDSGGSGYGY